jgi:DNA-binding MarR family transcriptional regulator
VTKLTFEKMNGVSHLSHPVCEMADELMRLTARFRTLFADATEQSGVSPLAYAVFIYIAEAGAPPTVPQIGRSIGHVRQVVQRAVNELIELGWVEPIENPNHKRAPLLQLADKGRDFKHQSDERVMRIGDDLLSKSNDEVFLRGLEDLRAIRRELEAYIRNYA